MLLHDPSFYCFPGRCLLCGDNSQRPVDLCLGCESDLPRCTYSCQYCAVPLPQNGICGRCQVMPPPFSKIVCPLLYQPPVDKLIQRLKYHKDLPTAAVLGQLLLQQVKSELENIEKPDAIIAVPLHWRRRLFRGFNQSQQLACQLSRALDIPIKDNCIRRIKSTRQQQKLSFKERTQNLKGAFKTIASVQGKRLALVDDVVTSGVTVSTIAKLLINNGATDIQVWCLARTPLWK